MLTFLASLLLPGLFMQTDRGNMAAAGENTAVIVGEGAESDEEAKLQMLKGELAVSMLACSLNLR